MNNGIRTLSVWEACSESNYCTPEEYSTISHSECSQHGPHRPFPVSLPHTQPLRPMWLPYQLTGQRMSLTPEEPVHWVANGLCYTSCEMIPGSLWGSLLGTGIQKQEEGSHWYYLPNQERWHELETERNRDYECEGEGIKQKQGMVSGRTGRERSWQMGHSPAMWLAEQRTPQPKGQLSPQTGSPVVLVPPEAQYSAMPESPYRGNLTVSLMALVLSSMIFLVAPISSYEKHYEG